MCCQMPSVLCSQTVCPDTHPLVALQCPTRWSPAAQVSLRSPNLQGALWLLCLFTGRPLVFHLENAFILQSSIKILSPP